MFQWYHSISLPTTMARLVAETQSRGASHWLCYCRGLVALQEPAQLFKVDGSGTTQTYLRPGHSPLVINKPTVLPFIATDPEPVQTKLCKHFFSLMLNLSHRVWYRSFFFNPTNLIPFHVKVSLVCIFTFVSRFFGLMMINCLVQ